MDLDLRIDNGVVITMDSRRRIIKDGTVVVNGDKIVDVGKTAELSAKYPAKKVIDAKGKIVMPGIVDAHLHNVQTLARALGDEVDLIAWCYDRIYPYEVLLTEEDTYISAMLSCLEMIKTGTTCVADPGGYRMDNVGRAFLDSGMRGILCWSGMDQWSDDRPLVEGLPGKLNTDQTMKEEERLVREWNGKANGRIRAGYGLRVEPNVSDELYRRIKRAADRDGVLIQYHAAVNQDQVDWVIRHTGHRVIEHMNYLGVLGPNWLLTHMACLSDEELKMLKDNDVKVCHNPGATLHGAYAACSHGKFPEMLEMGITVAMGCDSTAANNSLDMFRTMYQVATTHKEVRVIPDLIPPEQAMDIAIRNGARAVLWDNEIGSLEKGKKADLLVVDFQRTNWLPIHDFSIVPNLVYAGEGRDVETTIIDGNIVMENRVVKTINEKKLLEQAQTAAERIVARLPYKIEPRWPIE